MFVLVIASYNVTLEVALLSYTYMHRFRREEIHIKLVPKCVEVTRQDCVTKWRVTSGGQKVWDGNENCTPVKWQNCTLHEVPKAFNQTYTSCSRTGKPIPSLVCNLVEKKRLTTATRCRVKSAVDCKCTST